MFDTAVYTGPKASDSGVEQYNATIAIHQIKKTVIDDKTLYNLSHNLLKQQQSKYGKLVCLSFFFVSVFVFCFLLLLFVVLRTIVKSDKNADSIKYKRYTNLTDTLCVWFLVLL